MTIIFGQLLHVTNSTQKATRGDKTGLIFEIRIGTKVHQYYVSKINAGSLNLVCACKKCTSAITIKCSFLKYSKTTPAGRKVYEIDETFSRQELFNVETWGPVSHKCGRYCNSGCKLTHIPQCTMTSSSSNVTHRIMAEDLKSRRENDLISEPKHLVSATMSDYVPSGNERRNERRLRAVIYTMDKKTKRTHV